jgi:hypothetical protein
MPTEEPITPEERRAAAEKLHLFSSSCDMHRTRELRSLNSHMRGYDGYELAAALERQAIDAIASLTRAEAQRDAAERELNILRAQTTITPSGQELLKAFINTQVVLEDRVDAANADRDSVLFQYEEYRKVATEAAQGLGLEVHDDGWVNARAESAEAERDELLEDLAALRALQEEDANPGPIPEYARVYDCFKEQRKRANAAEHGSHEWSTLANWRSQQVESAKRAGCQFVEPGISCTNTRAEAADTEVKRLKGELEKSQRNEKDALNVSRQMDVLRQAHRDRADAAEALCDSLAEALRDFVDEGSFRRDHVNAREALAAYDRQKGGE